MYFRPITLIMIPCEIYVRYICSELVAFFFKQLSLSLSRFGLIKLAIQYHCTVSIFPGNGLYLSITLAVPHCYLYLCINYLNKIRKGG